MMCPFDSLLSARPVLRLAAWLVLPTAILAQTFSHTELPTSGSPTVASAGDVNFDGLPDIMVGDGMIVPTEMEMFLADGLGGFDIASTVLSGLGLTNALEVVDINRDGFADVIHVIATHSGYHGVHVYAGDGSGAFQLLQTVGTPDGGNSLALGDLNGDGFEDAVVADFSGYSIVYINRDGTLNSGTAFPADAGTNNTEFADMNLDGELDLVSSNFFAVSSNVTVALNLGGAQFGPPRRFPVGLAPSWVAAGDLNEDGIPDAVSSQPYLGDQRLVLQLGTGTGALRPGPILSVGASPSRVFIVDVNQDGANDLLAPMTSSTGLAYFPGRFGRFPVKITLPTGLGPVWVEPYDWTGDGLIDLAVTNPHSNTVSLLIKQP